MRLGLSIGLTPARCSATIGEGHAFIVVVDGRRGSRPTARSEADTGTLVAFGPTAPSSR
jgi:hypothetical protein